MIEKELDELTEELLKKKGFKNQLIICIEELSELQKELCKFLRGKFAMQNIIEEVADVEIMLHQIKHIFNIDENLINYVKKQKIERTKNKIKND